MRSVDVQIGQGVKGTNVREEVTSEFTKFIDLENLEVQVAAIVGGSSTDPEVAVIKYLYPSAEVHYFNLTNAANDLNFHRLDINEEIEVFLDDAKFDLVVSSQVLEHVWNHSNYFKLVAGIARPGGLIWVNCPKSNLVHGSPHYYSAGFTAEYLANNLGTLDCNILRTGEIGNKRYYLAVHLARYWQSPEENEQPILHYNFQPGSKLGVLRKFIKDFPVRLYLSTIPRRDSKSKDFATEAYVGAQKQV
jgi:SAM-dependent methyltransferase